MAFSGVPEHLWPVLTHKLQHEIFDAGEVFSLALDEDGTYEVMVSAEEKVLAASVSSVWLIDHAWTYTPLSARQQLSGNPNLARYLNPLLSGAISPF